MTDEERLAVIQQWVANSTEIVMGDHWQVVMRCLAARDKEIERLRLEEETMRKAFVDADAHITELESHLKADGTAGPDDWVPQDALMAVLRRLQQAEAERDAAVTEIAELRDDTESHMELISNLEAERDAALRVVAAVQRQHREYPCQVGLAPFVLAAIAALDGA